MMKSGEPALGTMSAEIGATSVNSGQRRALDRRAVAGMVLLSAAWGLQQVAVKVAIPFMAPMFQMAVRSGLAAVCVGILVVLRREGWALRSRTWKPGVLVGLLFALEFVFIAEGLRFTSASHMSIFLYTAPIFAALGLHLRLPVERLAPFQWVGVALAFGGIVLTFVGRGPTGADRSSVVGDLLGVAAGACYGVTTVSIRLSRLSESPATVTLLYQLAAAALILLVAATLSGQTSAAPSWTLAASLVFQTVAVSFMSYLAWFALLRVYLASRLSVLSFMTPLFGVVFGVVMLDERLEPSFMGGAALVLAGISLVGARDVLRRNAASPCMPGSAPPSHRSAASDRMEDA